MVRAARYGIQAVVVHALVSALHGAAHARLNIPLSFAQNLFVVVVIAVAPLAAGVLLWRKHYLSGAIIFLCSMAGALIFGAYNHFVASSPDHVSHVAAAASGGWVIVFQATAVLLALVEAFGCMLGAWMMRLCLGGSRLMT